MVLISLSYTGENSTGSATFTIAQEYKFKNIYLEDVKYYISSSSVEESVNGNTANAGLGGITTTILSPLAIKFDFLDTKDCVLYSLDDGSAPGETLNDPINITGLIPIGRANKLGSTPSAMSSTMSHSYPYKIISNRPQTWEVGKTITIDLYYRDVNTAGLVKDWALISGTTDAFGDVCSIDITLRLE
tara:strand:+ start:308 stop:871 length:564 start_codon:yes stop_codon:yes gene_type:complete